MNWRLFSALETLCQDSLESSVDQVRERPPGDQITDAMQTIIHAADTLQAVNDNALAWHAGEDGKARALNVIGIWTSEALAGRVDASVETLRTAKP